MRLRSKLHLDERIAPGSIQLLHVTKKKTEKDLLETQVMIDHLSGSFSYVGVIWQVNQVQSSWGHCKLVMDSGDSHALSRPSVDKLSRELHHSHMLFSQPKGGNRYPATIQIVKRGEEKTRNLEHP